MNRNNPSLHDAELLLGAVVIAMSAVGTLVFLSRRCRVRPPDVRDTSTRYVVVSDKHAVDARRYVLEPNARAPCMKCGANPVSTIFADCGHSVACPSCAHGVWKAERKCPLCHRPLESVLHIVGHVNVSTAETEVMLVG
jgi:hypothetical protein